MKPASLVMAIAISLFVTATDAGEPARVFRLRTGMALEFGRWEITLRDAGRMDLLHDFHGKVKKWEEIKLPKRESRELWRVIELAELTNRQSAQRAGIPGEIRLDFRLEDGGLHEFWQWEKEARQTDSLRNVLSLLGGIAAKHSESKKMWFVHYDQTAAWTRQLKEDIDSFRLSLDYVGAEDKPYYRLYLHVAEEGPRRRQSPFYRRVRLSRDEALRLVDGLAREGFLRECRGGEAKVGGERAYVLRIANNQLAIYDNLGFGERMRQRLTTLRTLLHGNAAVSMNFLLGRLGIKTDSRG